MSFDISRSTFRPRKNFLGVVMQQGRVQLDSDWNEWQSEFKRRTQAGTLDTVGQAVYPASTPNAFKITPGTDANGNPTLSIGAGRYYVDGLLAENHGPESQATWDTALAELSGSPAYSNTSAATGYTQQPYLPGATLPGSGSFLAYLDVWQRDVTYLEDPHLIDKAINIDTTGRLQTVWQVKLLDLSNSPNADCSTDIAGFDSLLAPPAARLTSGHVSNASSGPCCLAPNTGFTGQENQFYRVEIHQPGAPGAAPSGGFSFPLPANTPTFKWSRDNASVETSVSAISTGSVSTLTVASLGRDQVLGFRVNDWIEITDDAYELNGQPGEIFQITAVNKASRTLTLNGAVSAHFPLTSGQTDPRLHMRIRRWDQSGKVNQTDASGNTTLWIDLGGPGSNGQIPVPPPGVTLVLENGVTVAFDLAQQTGAAFRTGDYWNFAARTADGSVETLTSAPPFGIHHHYARLSIVTFPSTATDCRVEWPPSETETGCCCTVNVSPADLKGDTTLQAILDKYQNQATPVTICMETGTYTLAEPLRLTQAHSNITIEACQPGAAVLQAQPNSDGAFNGSQFNDGLIVVDNSTNIRFSGLTFLVPLSAYAADGFAGLPVNALPASVISFVQSLVVSIGIRVISGTGISVTQCTFELAYTTAKAFPELKALLAAGVFLNGQNDSLGIDDNQFTLRALRFLQTGGLFSTGILLAPGVSFVSPVTIQTVQAPAQAAVAPPANLSAKTAKAKTAKKAAAVAEAPAATTGIADQVESVLGKLEESGVQLVGGLLQNLGGFAASTPATLASKGGSVLAATLDNSTIRNNTFSRLTAAAYLAGEPGSLTASGNQVSGCSAGVWIVTPLQTQQLLTDPQNLSLLGATAAFGYPLPANTLSSPTAVGAVPASTRIYAGAANYTDSSGNVWLPDSAAKNVTISGGGITRPVPPPNVTGTNDKPLYQSERYGNFSYTFNSLPAGYYTLTLKFAEIIHTDTKTNKGERVFNVTVNGQPVLTNFDIVADAGTLVADDKIFIGIAPNSAGQIVVQFTGNTNVADPNPKVDAVELAPLWTGAPYLGSGSESDAANFLDQLAQLSAQAYAAIGFNVMQLRVQDNDMQGLSAPGVLVLGDDRPASANWSALTITGNRVDGEIAETLRFGANVSFARFIPGAFYFLVVVINVSRSTVSANTVANGTPTDGFGPSLYLDDSSVAKPAIVVMSNVLAGAPRILPPRSLSDTTLDATLQSWNFLNTIVS